MKKVIFSLSLLRSRSTRAHSHPKPSVFASNDNWSRHQQHEQGKENCQVTSFKSFLRFFIDIPKRFHLTFVHFGIEFSLKDTLFQGELDALYPVPVERVWKSVAFNGNLIHCMEFPLKEVNFIILVLEIVTLLVFY